MKNYFPKIIPVWLGIHKKPLSPLSVSISFEKLELDDDYYDLVVKTFAFRLDYVSLEECKKDSSIRFLRKFRDSYLIESDDYIKEEGENFFIKNTYHNNYLLEGPKDKTKFFGRITAKPYTIDFRDDSYEEVTS